MPRSRTYTFATLVNDNAALQNLVDLGVNLAEIEAKHNAADLLLSLTWQDMQPKIEYLMKIGI